MMYDALITPFLVQSALIEGRTGTDAYAGATYSTGVSVPARWFDEIRVIRTDDAREITSSAHVSVQADVSVGDRITDPHGRKREVVHVRVNRALSGALSHRVAYLA